MPNINDYGLPFTSQDGDRKYSALEWREYFSRLIHNGLIQNAANECQVKPQAVPNKTIYVDTGVVFVNGAMRILDSPITLTVAENTSGNPRIDRVVARLNEASRTIEFAVKQGTPAGSPVAPTLTRTEGVYELGLADITLANGYSTITSGAISDKRWDVSLCGASSMTIGVIPPSGLEAETVALSAEAAGIYGVANVDGAFKIIKNALRYGKYSQLSGGSTAAGFIAFSQIDNDDFSALNIASYPTRITIPSGVTKVRLRATVAINNTMQSSAQSVSVVKLYKNGIELKTIIRTVNNIENIVTEVLSVSPGDYFELHFTAGTSGSLGAGSLFSMEVMK